MRNTLIGLAVVGLIGCGGSDGDSGLTAPNDFDTFSRGAGVFAGTIGSDDASGALYAGITMVSPEGEVVSFAVDENNDSNLHLNHHRGSGENGRFAADGHLWQCNTSGACEWHESALEGTLDQTRMTATERWASTRSVPVRMTKDMAVTGLSYPLASIANEYTDGYTTLLLDSNGSLSGWDLDGCNLSGSLAPYDGINLFALSVSVSGCSSESTFSGLAFVLGDEQDGHLLWGMTSTGEVFFPMVLLSATAASSAADQPLTLTPPALKLKTLSTEGRRIQ
ncbi:hypothetical protein KUV89_07945 [Marinobacter hydrocarbonoclasticus]|nr:hypothetical protein [Marinobacter nauticus]